MELLDLNQVNCTDTCPVIVMSVDWFNVSVKNLKTQNVVTWDVDQENSKIFNVQRSSTGKEFETIGSVIPKEDGVRKYTYTDNQPNEGNNYYRIQEVDKDGTKNNSKVISTYNYVEDLYGEIIKRFDVMGNEVDENYKGVIIEHYSSGRYKKIIRE